MIGGKIVEIKERVDAHIRLKIQAVHPSEDGLECYIKLAYKPGLAALIEVGDTVWWEPEVAHVRIRDLGKDVECKKLGDAFTDLEAPAASSIEERLEYCGSAGGLAMFRRTPAPRVQLIRNGEPVTISTDVIGQCPEMIAASVQHVIERASGNHPNVEVMKMALRDLHQMQR